MVLKKRTYYGGFHGLLVPVIPKAPRSLRRRNSRNESSKDGEICAFELLAAVAGQLLQESESSTSSTNIPKEKVNHEPLEVKVKVKPTNPDTPLNELPQSENDSGSEHASIVTSSDFVIKIDEKSRIEAFEGKNEDGFSNLNDVKFGDNRAEIQAGPIEKQSSVHLPFYRRRGDVNIKIRDDDEKYFRYNNCSRRRRAFGSRSRGGYKRMRKMMTCRYGKASPKMKDYELANTTSGGIRSFYHKRKNIYKRERCQADAASKRRKLFHRSLKTAYIKDESSENISNSVKFTIKSFKVPEMYVEVPETATVGSLKRSVVEAIKGILRGKLHLGVLLQGKLVRDDNRTLQQSGILRNSNLESLGFTLEPSFPEASTSLVHEETPLLLSRSPPPIIDLGLSISSSDPLSITTSDNHLETNQESTTFPAEGTTEERVTDSKALVRVPSLDAEVLAMVPASENPIKRYELSQRRIRRPFSVSEVEALVGAVETLGAGRWRDVKMRAFDDANHRTYVDLKDKWKTLVHTASIAPKQRRGEPVPQDVLDRVLAAHAYWSQNQSKQHTKNQKISGVPL